MARRTTRVPTIENFISGVISYPFTWYRYSYTRLVYLTVKAQTQHGAWIFCPPNQKKLADCSTVELAQSTMPRSRSPSRKSKGKARARSKSPTSPRSSSSSPRSSPTHALVPAARHRNLGFIDLTDDSVSPPISPLPRSVLGPLHAKVEPGTGNTSRSEMIREGDFSYSLFNIDCWYVMAFFSVSLISL